MALRLQREALEVHLAEIKSAVARFVLPKLKIDAEGADVPMELAELVRVATGGIW